MNDTVLLFHGIARTKKSMEKLASFLSGHGYRVVNVGYPSTRFSISDLVDIIRPEIDDAVKKAGDGRVHFVGYSMGGLVIRAFLKSYRPAKLGRVVMVGTPNNGSQIADFLKSWPLYRKVYGPAGQQLITDQTAMTELFGPLPKAA
jgi:triacylglycerol esterase/lipase EstA (alpha/beta hydrolase family)